MSRISSTDRSSSGGEGGVCMMSIKWRDEQHPAFINFISTFLSSNSFRLNFVPIAPDLIFNCGGVSIAFMFVTTWNPSDDESINLVFSRALKLKAQFKYLYIVVTLATKEQNDSFVRSYFKSGVEIGSPTFIQVMNLEMGFENIVRTAHSVRVMKQSDAVNRMKEERKREVQSMDTFLRIVTSIPGLDSHDANSLKQGVGSIAAIARASKEYILENTDLSAEKAETVIMFFRDPKFYLSPKLN